MPQNQIKMNSDEWDKFYESQGSRYLQLESQALQAHGEDQKKLFYEILNSTIKLIQVIGVVAGFGFAAMAYVVNVSLFVVGEACLFSAIFIGLWWTQKVYRENLRNSTSEVVRVKRLFKERFDGFKKIYDKALSDIEASREIEIPESDIRNLMKSNNTMMEEFIAGATESRQDKDPLYALMTLFGLGGISLLLSFITFCLY